MSRVPSKISADWWDYTTFAPKVLEAAANLQPEDLLSLSRPALAPAMWTCIEG